MGIQKDNREQGKMQTRDETEELIQEQLCCKQDTLQNICLTHTRHILHMQQNM